MKILKLAVRNAGRNLRRSVLSGSAVGFSALVITLFFSFYEGIRMDLTENIKNYMSGEVRAQHRDFEKNSIFHPLGLAVPEAGRLASLLQGAPGVRAVSPRIGFGTGIYRDGRTYRARALGVDFRRETRYQDLEKILAAGRLPRDGEREALVAGGLAREMGISEGDKITLLAQTRGRGSNAVTLTVAGLAEFPVASFNEGFLMLPLERAERLLRMEGFATEILVKLEPGTDEGKAAEELSRLAAAEKVGGWEGLEVRSWKTIGPSYGLIRMMELSYAVIALVFILLGSTVVVNTTIMVVFERTREIGTVAALGMEERQISRLFALEAVVIGAAGAFLGVAAGIAIVLPLSRIGMGFGSAMGEVAMEISETLYPALTLKSTVFVFFYTVLVSALAALIPARRAAKIRPVEALRTDT